MLTELPLYENRLLIAVLWY